GKSVGKLELRLTWFHGVVHFIDIELRRLFRGSPNRHPSGRLYRHFGSGSLRQIDLDGALGKILEGGVAFVLDQERLADAKLAAHRFDDNQMLLGDVPRALVGGIVNIQADSGGRCTWLED